MPANLNNTGPIDPDDPAYQTLLAKLQGNILKGHGRDHSVNIFFTFSDGAPADLPAIRQRLVGLAARYVTSAARQLRDRDLFKATHRPTGTFGNFFLTSQGYQKLGFTRAQIQAALPEQPGAGNPQNAASNFADGMAAHGGADLNDPSPTTWEETYNGGDIDAMILIADSDPDFLKVVEETLVTEINRFATVLGLERGSVLRNAIGDGIEHFGYVDGRSQPIYIDDDMANEGTTLNWNPFEPLARVLVADGLSKDADDAFGSFFVFRKLEQDIRGFVKAEQDLAAALGLEGPDVHRAGAMAVGRFRDGSPLALASAPGALPDRDNDFQYNVDPDPLRCPFQAHIRKANPRGDIQRLFGAPAAAEHSRRITRRAIPYGDAPVPTDASEDHTNFPAVGSGLLFMCFQADISAQFAFMQKSWVNNEGFVTANVGQDPVIGQRPLGGVPAPIPQQWNTQWGRPATGSSQFGGFVTLKGGEFFFAPSLPFLSTFGP